MSTTSATAVTVKTFSTTGDLGSDGIFGTWEAEFSYDIDEFSAPPIDFTSSLTSFKVDFFNTETVLQSSISSEAGNSDGSFIGNQDGTSIINFSTDNVLDSNGNSTDLNLTLTLLWDQFQM